MFKGVGGTACQGWAGREEITTVDKYKVLGILLSVSGSGLRVEMETKVR